MTNVLIAVVAFVLMEPVAVGAHRLVMHGRGWAWHRSHHVGRHTRLEANDLYPAVFSSVTVAAMAVAVVAGWTSVLVVGTGVTTYGLAYLTVHDVCVHGRLSGGPPRARPLAAVGGCLPRPAPPHERRPLRLPLPRPSPGARFVRDKLRHCQFRDR